MIIHLGLDHFILAGFVIDREGNLRAVVGSRNVKREACVILCSLKAAVRLPHQKNVVVPDAGLKQEIEINQDEDDRKCDAADNALPLVSLPDTG